MKTRVFFPLLFMCIISTYGIAQNNYVVITSGDTIWTGTVPEMTTEILDEISEIPQLVLSPLSENTTLPYKVDNSTEIWMRDIFNQQGGSCSQAAAIGYTFTYEIDRLRNVAAYDSVNLYPVDFTYNFLNEGDAGNGSLPQHGFNIAKDVGCPNVTTYGGMWAPSKKWMNGYEKYFSALYNRVKDNSSIYPFLNNGFNEFKHWMHDHGSGQQSGGFAVFIVDSVQFPMTRGIISSGEEIGQEIVKSWLGNNNNPITGHTMTIVGYNDSIKYDFNNDSQISEWEKGAVKVANSWGIENGWTHDGYVFVPYFMIEELFIPSQNVFYIMDADTSFVPEIVLKATVDHNRRDKLKFYTSYTQTADSLFPLVKNYRTYFPFSIKKGGPFPMLGINGNPMEFALDFSYWFSDRKVGKVFFIVHQDTTLNGTINNFSLVDYRWNETGSTL